MNNFALKFLIVCFVGFLLQTLFAIAEDDWSKNVERERNGDVFIKDIPVVKQEGGFCVPGSVTMVVQYFDARLNIERLGKIFDTDFDNGTFIKDMVMGFSKRKLFEDFEFKQLYYLWDDKEEIRNLIGAYVDERDKKLPSKEARRTREINKIYKNGLFFNLDVNIAKTVFSNSRENVRAFLTNEVRRCIDRGVPVLWSVMMQFDPRDRRKSGHMRVIVGYTEKEGELVELMYCDSWGTLSRYRKVSFDDAMTMTNGLFLIVPKGKKNAERTGNILFAEINPKVAIELVPVAGSESVKPFLMGKFEVTQNQFRLLMKSNRSRVKGEDFPATNVSWNDAMEFCRRLTEKNRASGKITAKQSYSLPTKEQWMSASCMEEYSMEEFKKRVNWRGENLIFPVGKTGSNRLGIFDINSNAYELIADAKSSYSVWLAPGWNFYRGKITSYRYDASIEKPALALSERPLRTVDFRDELTGFRIVLNTSDDQPFDPSVFSEELKRKTEESASSIVSVLADPESEKQGGISVPLSRKVSLEMARIPAGENFPAFYMGKYEVTQEEYLAIMGKNPSWVAGKRNPVERVSWNEAAEFCRKLTLTARVNRHISRDSVFMLPTREQWEYACRAGTAMKFYSGNTEKDFARAAWYKENASGKTHSVGGKEPNLWGLYDMLGNVREWILEEKDGLHIAEGGAFCDGVDANLRAEREAADKDRTIGFRVVLVEQAEER